MSANSQPNNIYIGNRYVPIFADPVEWNNLREYEPLTIVTYQGTSYTSKQTVPVGTPLNDTNYWVVTGNYNAQVAELLKQVTQLNTDFSDFISKYFPYDDILSIGKLNEANGVLLGGESFNGTDGFLLRTDGNTSWGVAESTKMGSKTELTVQSRIYTGNCDVVNGRVTITSGTNFDINLPLKNIWINNVEYGISSYISSTQLQLSQNNVNLQNAIYQFAETYSIGKVNTSGNTITYVSGDKFAYWWAGKTITVNGSNYTITQVLNNGTTLVVGTNLPEQNNVNYILIDDATKDVAALGINKRAGENEERFVITAKAYGEYRMSTVKTGNGKHYNVYIDVNDHNLVELNTLWQMILKSATNNPQLGFKDESGNNNSNFFIQKDYANDSGNFQLYNESKGVIAEYSPKTNKMAFNTDVITGNLLVNSASGNPAVQIGQNNSVYVINADGNLTLYDGNDILKAYKSLKQIDFIYTLKLPNFSKQNLPTNATSGAIAYCNNLTTPKPVVYNGTAWVDFMGNAI